MSQLFLVVEIGNRFAASFRDFLYTQLPRMIIRARMDLNKAF